MKERRPELEIYSGIAILFVVLLHSNAYYLSNVLKLGAYLQAGVLLYVTDKIIHIAVPMFIFIAGFKYQMNNIGDTYGTFFAKKLKGVFIPFFLLSTFYLIYFWSKVFYTRWVNTGYWDVQYVLTNMIPNFFKMFLGYNFAYQFWYIPMYLLIVLSYPLIAKGIKNIYIRFAMYFAVAVFWEVIVSLRVPFINNYPYPIKFVYYFFLYELGCIFYHKGLYKRNLKPMLALYVLLLGAACLVKNALHARILYELVLTPVAVMAFYDIARRLKDNRMLTYLGKNSLYIYMLHEPLILSVISRYLLRKGMYRYGLLDPVIAVVSIVLSVAVYRGLRKLWTIMPLYKASQKTQAG